MDAIETQLSQSSQRLTSMFDCTREEWFTIDFEYTTNKASVFGRGCLGNVLNILLK